MLIYDNDSQCNGAYFNRMNDTSKYAGTSLALILDMMAPANAKRMKLKLNTNYGQKNIAQPCFDNIDHFQIYEL